MFSDRNTVRDSAFCIFSTYFGCFSIAYTTRSICPSSSLISFAMNLLAAVSPAQSPVFGSRHSSTTVDDEVPAGTSAVVGSETGLNRHTGRPKARSRRRSSQSKTIYQLAHPPPSVRHRQRFRLRPKTLLQLRQVSNTSRPIPLFDVLPLILFAPRLFRRVPRILQNKQGLGLDDLVFIQSQSRTSLSTAPEGSAPSIDQDGKTDCEIIAAICQSSLTERNGPCRTEIRFSSGATWTATALRSGAYEFASDGEVGIRSIARWVPRRDDMQMEGTGTSERSELAAFKFSLVDVRSRRHPVIANMSRQSISVYDQYSIPSSPQVTPRHCTIETFDQVGSVPRGEIIEGECSEPCKAVIETDDDLRTLIAITGIWVAFCEQWSPNFRYSTKQVISNGISELSNRRRSEGAQPLALSVDNGSRRRFSIGNETRHRPNRLQNWSLPSIPSLPSSPPSGSLAPSPQRSASTSTTVFGEHDSHHGAWFEAEHPSTPGNRNHIGTGNPGMSNLIVRKADKPLRRAGSILSQGSSSQRGEESLGTAAVVAEGMSKRQGMFRRVVDRLKQTRSSR